MPLAELAAIFLSRPHRFILAGVLCALTVALVAAVALDEMRGDALRRACDSADNITLLLERDIKRSLDISSQSLQSVAAGVQSREILALPPAIRQRTLFGVVNDLGDVGAEFVADGAGNVVFDSRSAMPGRVNIADRDYFKVHQDSPDAGLFISKPLMSRVPSVGMSIVMSRRVADMDGAFSGIAFATFRLGYFHQLFDGTALGKQGSITLLLKDGTVFMRRPYRDSEIGRNISSAQSFKPLLLADKGAFIGTAALDGTHRLYSFRHVGSYPLIIVIGLGTDEIYAEWKRRAMAIGGAVAVLDLLLVLMSVLFAKQFQRRLEIERTLQRIADTDSLTGLGTRRALEATLDREWRRAKRNRQRLAMLMIDVDHFKAYNDRYGHLDGDDVLKRVAQRIVGCIRRPGDFAGRYGGEEFCVLLPETGMAGAWQVAETIRQSIRDAACPHGAGSGGTLSVSIGAAVLDGSNPEGMTASELIGLADRQLYEAKVAGRNIVMPRANPDTVQDVGVEPVAVRAR